MTATTAPGVPADAVGGVAPTPPASDAGGPYPGLRPFREGERLFGRDSEINIIVDRILANRLTLLFAAAGVGKSSLLSAGVMPRLRDAARHNLQVVYHNRWVTDADADLRATLLQAFEVIGSLEGLPGELPLPELIALAASFVRPPLVLILDQFEEFFRYRRSQPEFDAFIRGLTEVISDSESAIAVVIAMREDFAMELNAFNPGLPGRLFENFYRLEPLTEAAAAEAIRKPAAAYGFDFEEQPTKEGPLSLLSVLVDDLSSRVRGGLYINPVAERVRAVEPPYLQIVCERLWQLDRDDPERKFRFDTYQRAERAAGILRSYIYGKLGALNRVEKLAASKAFGHLVGRSGTKNAATVRGLAQEIAIKPARLEALLRKLEEQHILRAGGEGRRAEEDGAELWYELYHDAFSEHVDRWNEEFRARERRRQGVILALQLLAIGVTLFIAYDVVQNLTSRHFRLSEDPEAAAVLELYEGKADSWDLFGLQHYVQQTHFTRSRLDPDWIQSHTPIAGADLDQELARMVQPHDRVRANAEMGRVSEALELAKKLLASRRKENVTAAIASVGEIRTHGGVEQLAEWLKQGDADRLSALILALRAQRHPWSITALVEASKGSLPESARADVLRALGANGLRSDVLEALNLALRSSVKVLQLAALDVLAGMPLRAEIGIPALHDVLTRKETSSDVWNKAMSLVAEKRLASSLPALISRPDIDETLHIKALQRQGGQAALDALTAMLPSHQNPGLIAWAIAKLGPAGGPPLDRTATLRGLRSALSVSDDPEHQLFLALSLTQLGDPGAVQELIRWSVGVESSHGVCDEIRSTIGKFARASDLERAFDAPRTCLTEGASGILLEVERRGSPGQRLPAPLARLIRPLGPEAALDEVRTLAHSPTAERRERAVDLLSYRGPEGLETLLRLATDPSRRVSRKAVQTLAALPGAKIEPVVRRLKGPRLKAIVLTLRQVEGGSAALRAYVDRTPSARSDPLVAQAVAEMDGDWAAAYFSTPSDAQTQQTKSTEEARINATVGYLHRIGPRSSTTTAALVPFLSHPESDVRNEAIDALARIGGEPAEAQLGLLLSSREVDVRIRASQALLEMRTPAASQRVAMLLRSETAVDVRERLLKLVQGPQHSAAELVSAIETLLDDPPLQSSALDALVRLEATRSAPAIQPLLKVSAVSSGAALALAELGSRAGLQRLFEEAALERRVNASRPYSATTPAGTALLDLGAYEDLPELTASMHSDLSRYWTTQSVLPLTPERAVSRLFEVGYTPARTAFLRQLQQTFQSLRSIEQPVWGLSAREATQMVQKFINEETQLIDQDEVPEPWRNYRDASRAGQWERQRQEAGKRREVLFEWLERAGTEHARDVLASGLERSETRLSTATALAHYRLDEPLKLKVQTLLEDHLRAIGPQEDSRQYVVPDDDIALAAGHVGIPAEAWIHSRISKDAALVLNGPGALEEWRKTKGVRKVNWQSYPWRSIYTALEDAPHNPHTEALLLELLADDFPRVRARAAEAVGTGRYETLSPALVERLADEIPSVRAAALKGLVRLLDPHGFEAIARLVREPTTHLPLRIEAIAALPLWAERDPSQYLARTWDALRAAALADERALGFKAYLAMGQLLDQGAAPAGLIAALEGRLSAHREREAAFRTLRERPLPPAEDEEARAQFRRMLAENAPFRGLTYEVAFLLCKAEPKRAESELIEDDLLEVRNAAITYLVLKGEADALERIDQRRFNFKETRPILRAAQYQAIDRRLRVLETTATERDVSVLRRWLGHASDLVVAERVEWTIEAILDRLKHEGTP